MKSNGLRHLYDKHVGDDPERIASFEEELANAGIAQKIHDLPHKAGLTRQELVKQVGTTASVSYRLGDAHDEGYSLPMLRRIVAALNRRVEIRFVPLKKSLRTA